MIGENIKSCRRARGLSQQQLADRLHVVRQTVSKWELSLSVPDALMLMDISSVLQVSLDQLMDHNCSSLLSESEMIDQKVQEILAVRHRKRTARILKVIQYLSLTGAVVLLLLIGILWILKSPWLGWNMADPETAVLAVLFHGFEWMLIRLAPLLFAGFMIVYMITAHKKTE